MNINLRVYNAIQKGLNEALSNLSIDDFDDIEIDDQKLNHEEIIIHSGKEEYKKWKFIKDNFVDLGLPSGTLWMKHNLGATCEDIPESWYGNYYAWGETKMKSSYTEENYTYKEEPNILPLSNDIAYLTNEIMHMPAKEQIEELKSVPNEWVKNYNGIDGLNGILFTSPGGNELFIPAAGFRYGNDVNNRGFACDLWSSHLD